MEVELPNGKIGEFPDSMSNEEVAAVLRKQFPAPKSKGFVDSAVDGAKNLAVGVATGAGQIGSALLSPVDMGYDAVTGQPLGTSNRLRRQSIEGFGKDNADTDSINYTVGNLAPEMIATAGPIGMTGAAVSKAPLLAKTLGRLAPAAGDIATNAAYAAGKAAYNGEDVGGAALAGGAGATAGRVLQRTLGGVVRGAKGSMSPEARTLYEAGVTPTPGQMFGDGIPGRIASGIEDAASFVPGVGSVISYAKNRAIRDYNNVEINAALAPLGQRVEGAGAKAVGAASQGVSDTYDRVLPNVFITTGDAAKATSRDAFQNTPLLDGMQSARISRFVLDRIHPLLREENAVHGGKISGEAWKAIDAEIGAQARKYANAFDPMQHPLGDGFYALQQSWRDAMQGAGKAALSDTDRAYRSMVPISKASDAVTSGVFTPRQLNRATVRAGQDPSELNLAAQATLSPASSGGVADTLRTGAKLAGLGGAVVSGTAAPVVAATGAAALLYSRPGMNFVINGLGGVVPESIRRQLASLPPMQAAHVLDELAKQNPVIGQTAQSLGAQFLRAYATQQQQGGPNAAP